MRCAPGPSPAQDDERYYFVPGRKVLQEFFRGAACVVGCVLIAARYLSIQSGSGSTVRLIGCGVGISTLGEHPVIACNLR